MGDLRRCPYGEQARTSPPLSKNTPSFHRVPATAADDKAFLEDFGCVSQSSVDVPVSQSDMTRYVVRDIFMDQGALRSICRRRECLHGWQGFVLDVY